MSSPDAVVKRIREENERKELQDKIEKEIQGIYDDIKRAWDKKKGGISKEVLEKMLDGIKGFKDDVVSDEGEIEEGIQDIIDEIEDRLDEDDS